MKLNSSRQQTAITGEQTAAVIPPPLAPCIYLLIAVLLSACVRSGEGQAENAEMSELNQSEKWSSQRKAMLATLGRRGYGIHDDRVLRAMGNVPRHEFVPEDVRALAYADRPLPIGHDQTISQPYIVAFMTEQLEPEPHERVLEIGTGSGYQAAVLSGLVREVYTIEIVDALARRSAETLERLEFGNVHVRSGDGYRGWPERAPFDAIIVTCAPEEIPAPLVEQLKEGGRMMIPVGPTGGSQELYLLEKRQGQIERRAVLPVRFVPMTGEVEEDC